MGVAPSSQPSDTLQHVVVVLALDDQKGPGSWTGLLSKQAGIGLRTDEAAHTTSPHSVGIESQISQ